MSPYNQTIESEVGAGWLPRSLIALAVQATYNASLGDGTYPQLLDTLREAVYRDMAFRLEPNIPPPNTPTRE